MPAWGSRRHNRAENTVIGSRRPPAHGAARLYNDVTQEEMDTALALWKEMCT